ncbi:MAG TPA: GntR family transcriptional regulator [Geothrix sp.]|nr:GntR family transcriptional regulator [Geothrix sp.]
MAKPTLAVTIRDGIRARIEQGEWSERLPSEPELGIIFSASRETVRKALGSLEAEGLIYRIHGKGTFVEAKVAFNPLSGALSITEELSRSGLPVVNRVLTKGWLPTADLPSGFLRACFEGEERVFQVTRLRMVKTKPLALEVSYFRASDFPGIARAAFRGSLHDLMTGKFGFRPDRVQNRIQGIGAEPEALKEAQRSLGTHAVLRVERAISEKRHIYYAVRFILRTDLFPLEFTQIPKRQGGG